MGARLKRGDARGAVEDLQRASRLEPQNREVRQRLQEAQKLEMSTEPDPTETSLATSAVSALGGKVEGAKGLYDEKPDLNEGRLAETHRQQREWIDTIKNWKEIEDIAFAEEEGKISVYMTLPGVHELQSNKVRVWMTAQSLEVRVIDLAGQNWCYLAQELWSQIDPENSTWKARKGKLSLKLAKRASARSWDKWEKLRRI